MNPTLAVWLASLLGAGLFFLSGALFARFRFAAASREVAPDGDERSRALRSGQEALAASESAHREAESRLAAQELELVHSRRHIEEREAALVAAEGRIASVKQVQQQIENERRALESDRKRLEGNRQDLDGNRQRVESEQQRLQSELQRARSELAAALPLAGEVASLRAELQARTKAQAPVPGAIMNELVAVKAELAERVVERDRLALEVAAHKNRVAQLAAIETERHDLVRRLEEAERVGKERVDRQELADAKYELTMKGQLADARLVETNRMSEENAQLRASLSEMGRLKERVDELSRDLQEARAQRLTPLEGGGREELRAGGGHRLQTLVDRVAHLEGVRSVAIADAQGFVVAGSGEHADGLAAFSAFLIAAAARAGGVLPFRRARRLVVEDEGALMLSSYRLHIGENDLVLSLLTAGSEPEARTINELVDDTTLVSPSENTAPRTKRDANAEA